MMNYPTPHIDAKPEDFAKTVIMPGDPLRSKFIAENFLENAVMVNNVRGVQGYTGEYKGKKVSVMASGMGMPSMAIYSYELFNFFEVDNIIRIGTTGGLSEKVNVRDIVIAEGACTNSSYPKTLGIDGTLAPIANFNLLEKAVNTARDLKLNFAVGNVLTSDAFYNDSEFLPKEQQMLYKFAKMGVLAVEMETAALYINAMKANKNALSILTVSDHFITGEDTTAKERETTFTDMMKLALETALQLD